MISEHTEPLIIRSKQSQTVAAHGSCHLPQGHCSSCYAFASASAIASAVAIAQNQAPALLSPQPFVDCFWQFFGCGE